MEVQPPGAESAPLSSFEAACVSGAAQSRLLFLCDAFQQTDRKDGVTVIMMTSHHL